MNRKEYDAKREAGTNAGFTGIATFINDSLIKDEYIASIEARIAELEKLAVVWEKCESREQIDHSRRYCVVCHNGELWICYLPIPPEEQ